MSSPSDSPPRTSPSPSPFTPNFWAGTGAVTAALGTAGLTHLLRRDARRLAEVAELGKDHPDNPNPKNFSKHLEKSSASADAKQVYRTFARRAVFIGSGFCVCAGVAAASALMYQLQLESPKDLGVYLAGSTKEFKQSLRERLAEPLTQRVLQVNQAVLPWVRGSVQGLQGWYQRSWLGQWADQGKRDRQEAQDADPSKSSQLSEAEKKTIRDFLDSQGDVTEREKRSLDDVLGRKEDAQ